MAEKKAKKVKAQDAKEEAKPKHTEGKVNVYNLEGKVTGEQNLPAVFKTDFRPDVIRRAVTAIEANKRQPYAPSPPRA